MNKLSFGTKKQISFESENDFYRALGFLANGKRAVLTWEHNEDQGAWGSEGRIHCMKEPDLWPEEFQRSFTAGTGNIKARVNCNEYVEHICTNHNMQMGREQDIPSVESTVPEEYLEDFSDGLSS